MDLAKENPYFMELLMKYARDRSIRTYNGIVSGQQTAPDYIKLHDEIANFTDSQNRL